MPASLDVAWPSRWRLLTGFAVLPIIQALVAYLAFPLVWWLGDHGAFRPVDPDGAALAFALVTAFLGFVMTVAGAVPVVFWLRRRGRASLDYLLVAGLVLGNIPFAVYVVGLVVPMTIVHMWMGTMSQHLMAMSELLAGTVRAMLLGSTFGLMSAAVFWAVAFAGTGCAAR